MKHLLALTVALALAASSIDTFAADGNAGFVRAEIGNSNVSIDGDDDNDTAYGIRGGYFFNAYVGVEAFYSSLYDESDAIGSLEGRSYGIGVVGKKSMDAAHNGLFVSGRLGVARTQLDQEVMGLGSFEGTDTRAYIGAGIGYDFNENFGLSLDVTYQQPKPFDETFTATTTTIGIEYRF